MKRKKKNPLRRDPTRTGRIRSKMIRDIRSRLRKFRIAMRDVVVEQDAFGLRGKSALGHRWQFLTAADQVRQFEAWALAEGLVTGSGDFWTEFIEQGFAKGAKRAWDQLRPPAQSRLEQAFQGGRQAEFLNATLAAPETREKVELIASRVFTQLNGIDSHMAQTMGGVLADGLVTGSNPRVIARGLVKRLEIGRRRAETIARTEIIRAHAEGQLDSMERMGVQHVGVEVEWATAGDDRVCPICRPMEGKVYKIDKAHGVIPAHPNCRCAWLPANVGEVRKRKAG